MTFRGHGKLLLTGEYAVLDGALSLALPTKLGQNLSVSEGTQPGLLSWYSYDHRGSIWFFADLQLPQLAILGNSDTGMGKTLHKVLTTARSLNPDFLTMEDSVEVRTSLEFDNTWGLGSSSTLVYCIAKWAGVDPFLLQEKTFGGSGYDIACADAGGPILYRRQAGKNITSEVDYKPEYYESLFFVYLETKQDSREAIEHYRKSAYPKEELVHNMSQLTQKALQAGNLRAFEEVVIEHESLLSEVLQLPTLKEQYFHNFWGTTKSLGAWGGDFALATSDRSINATRDYFHKRGFTTVITWDELILQ